MKRFTLPLIAVLALPGLEGPRSAAAEPLVVASAIDVAALSEKKRTQAARYLSATEAASYLAEHEDALLIDVRTRAEVNFVGIATRADRNIPFKLVDEFWSFNEAKGTYNLIDNPDFVEDVVALVEEKRLGKDAMIVLICRSGSRSARAADLLFREGYKNVYSVVDGFQGDKDSEGHRTVNGWVNAGLAWSYEVRPDQAYDGGF